MDELLAWARGPCFIFAFIFMVLGLIRHLGLTCWEMIRVMRQAGDKTLPYSQVFSATLKWAFPIDMIKDRLVFSLTSVLFHIAILIVPIFLAGHIALWARGLGISWPAIPNSAADVLTIIAVVTAVALVVQRAAARATRSLSRFQDYVIPLVISVPFVTGFLAMHPSVNPFSFEAMLFVHIMSANLIFVLIPITKLSHMALLPSVQLVSEVGWHWSVDSGSKVAATLRKEEEPI